MQECLAKAKQARKQIVRYIQVGDGRLEAVFNVLTYMYSSSRTRR